MGNTDSSSGIIGAAAGVGSLALGLLPLLYPVTAVEQRNGKYKVCAKFERDDRRAPYDVCSEKGSGKCIERCAFNVPEFELPAIQRAVERSDGIFRKISRRRGKRDVPTNGWTF